MPSDQDPENFDDRLKSAFDIIDAQRYQIEAYAKSIAIIGEQLVSLHVESKITKIAVSVLLAEAAGKDRKKLDELLALSIARTESASDQLSAPVKAVVLSSIDELVTLTETALYTAAT